MNPLAIFDTLGKARKMLTLLAVVMAAATVYVWWQNAERNRLTLMAAADNICEAAGVPFRPEGVRHRDWGLACLTEVRRLSKVESDLQSASMTAAIQAMNERADLETRDAARAAEMARRTDQRVQNMEAADAAIEGDRAGPGWASALNELGGLRSRP